MIAQTFFGRKFRYAINAQVLAGMDRIIYDLFLGAPGKLHDSVVWRTSPVKVLVEGQHPLFCLLGDSAYPKSKVMVTPYRTPEAAADMTKRQQIYVHMNLLSNLVYFIKIVQSETVWCQNRVHRGCVW